ncbi:hypothetical protein NE237_023147 [Protea cynaroides]|uniref:Uncharacterized protein n=1 Tax=Protea cynaroides TaxID=273540 RepID=A0A9Q0HBP6_9MAGN|nr:hypothetical protein NE237_023147 [Protea cynaroides]
MGGTGVSVFTGVAGAGGGAVTPSGTFLFALSYHAAVNMDLASLSGTMRYPSLSCTRTRPFQDVLWLLDAVILAPRSSDGTAISFSVHKTTYAPAPTSGSAHHTFGLAHHTFGLAHQYKAAASASPCFRTSYSSAFAWLTESTTIGYSVAYVYGTGREARIGRETGQDGFGSLTGWIYRRCNHFVATGFQSRSANSESTGGLAAAADLAYLSDPIVDEFLISTLIGITVKRSCNWRSNQQVGSVSVSPGQFFYDPETTGALIVELERLVEINADRQSYVGKLREYPHPMVSFISSRMMVELGMVTTLSAAAEVIVGGFLASAVFAVTSFVFVVALYVSWPLAKPLLKVVLGIVFGIIEGIWEIFVDLSRERGVFSKLYEFYTFWWFVG